MKMNNFDIESLFSLEIVVDKLKIPNIQCRYPAVAFRLLDFPTLLIYHVEPELGETIKAKIRIDPLHKLGKQIPELLDKDGCFSMKKGKSCLMKMSPNMLLSHLTSTPLYVMVIDTFPETPKLIGNCTIPLDETMNRVYEDICKVGLAVPTVGGEKGCYKIFNLMGSEIGSLLLGIRILSLGVGLIPHIPASSISRSTKKESLPTKLQFNEIQEHVAEIALEDFEKVEIKNNAAAHFVHGGFETKPSTDIMTKTVHIPTQTERELLQNIATQTEKCKQQKRQKQTLDIASQIRGDLVDEIVVTNTICPPPLYFNNDLEPKHGKHFHLLESALRTPPNDDFSSDRSDEDTIRHEDVSDDEFEIENFLASQPVSNLKKTKSKTQQIPVDLPPNIKEFPLLNAIVTEIAALAGTSRENSKDALIQISKPARVSSVSPKRSRKPTDSKASPHRGRSPSPRRERESVEHFVKRMQSPTHTVRELPIVKPTYDTSHAPTPRKPTHSHKCDKGPEGVPKSKSWLRKTPVPMEVKKTKLAFGLTNTQKLRLEKSNPELLKSLEKKESERVQRFKELRRLEEEARVRATGPTKKLYDGTPIYNGFTAKDTYHRRPVPTPRNSLHHPQDSLFDDAHPLTTIQQVREQYRYQYNATPDIDVVAERENTLSDRSEHSVRKVKHGFVAQDEKPGQTFGRTKVIQPDQGFSGAQLTDGQESYADDFEDPTDRTEPRNLLSQRGVRAQPIAENLGTVSNESDDIQVTALDPQEVLGLRQMNENYSGEESESFQSAASQSDHVEVKPFPESIPTSVTKLVGPSQSTQKPMLAAKRPAQPLEKSNVTVEASVESTAYISRSQVFGNKSQDSDNSNIETKDSMPKRTVPSRVRRNTDSVSSYVGEDDTSPKSNTRNYSDDSFNDDDNLSEYAVPDPLSMKDLQISKEAKMGYTWA